MIAVRAQRAWLEQILEEAFSLRICCSLACKVKTKPFLPCWSLANPTILPGILLINFSVVAIKPRYGHQSLRAYQGLAFAYHDINS